jgi:phage terminase large subunit-like protein
MTLLSKTSSRSGSVSCGAWLASLTPSEREAELSEYNVAQLKELEGDWLVWARPEQLAPEGDWRCWLFLAGRGAGKTRSGAEWTCAQIAAGRRRVALVAPTAADARDVLVDHPGAGLGRMAAVAGEDKPAGEVRRPALRQKVSGATGEERSGPTRSIKIFLRSNIKRR